MEGTGLGQHHHASSHRGTTSGTHSFFGKKDPASRPEDSNEGHEMMAMLLLFFAYSHLVMLITFCRHTWMPTGTKLVPASFMMATISPCT